MDNVGSCIELLSTLMVVEETVKAHGVYGKQKSASALVLADSLQYTILKCTLAQLYVSSFAQLTIVGEYGIKPEQKIVVKLFLVKNNGKAFPLCHAVITFSQCKS